MFKPHCIYSQYAFNQPQICTVENPTKRDVCNTRYYNFWIMKYVALCEEGKVIGHLCYVYSH